MRVVARHGIHVNAEPAAQGRRSHGLAKLLLKDGTPDGRNQIVWKWASGAATTKDEVADPTGADYTLCVYDASPTHQPSLSPSGTAGGAWRETASGFIFKADGSGSGGLERIDLREGAAGLARIAVKGDGPDLRMPNLPLTPPVTVQLRNDATGMCWGAEHTFVLVGRGDRFVARGD